MVCFRYSIISRTFGLAAEDFRQRMPNVELMRGTSGMYRTESLSAVSLPCMRNPRHIPF